MKNAEGVSKSNAEVSPEAKPINLQTLLYKPIIHVLLIVMLGLLAYSNTFNVPFIFDDYRNIIDNPVIKNFQYPLDTEIAEIIKTNSIFKTRIIGYVTTLFHPSSLIPQPSLIALFSALIFVSHPIQTQAVTYIVQRFTSLATFFYLLSLVMYVKWRIQNTGVRSQSKTKTLNSKLLTLNSMFLYLASLASAILAMKTKEIAFTLPIIITAYEFMFFDEKIKKRVLYLSPLLLLMLIIPSSFIGTDTSLKGILRDISETARLRTTMSRWDYLLTEFRVIVTYLRLLFLPVNQNFDYDYPIYNSF
ncbi:MAG: hypothetical protein HY759_03835 [Nitrospirae bacterium]|nr:hypothetical protein [Nitrospirota bacterium]